MHEMELELWRWADNASKEPDLHMVGWFGDPLHALTGRQRDRSGPNRGWKWTTRWVLSMLQWKKIPWNPDCPTVSYFFLRMMTIIWRFLADLDGSASGLAFGSWSQPFDIVSVYLNLVGTARWVYLKMIGRWIQWFRYLVSNREGGHLDGQSAGTWFFCWLLSHDTAQMLVPLL